VAAVKARVLLTDGDQRASLSCLRALSGDGHECFVLEPNRASITGSSRYCRGAAVAPDPAVDPSGFFEILRERVAKWGCEILVPITEKSLRVVLPRIGELGEVRVPFPSADVFAAVSDKALVLRKAVELGMAVPKQWELDHPTRTSFPDLTDVRFPLVVKPSRSVVGLGKGVPDTGVMYAKTASELERCLATVPEEAYPVLVQERITGTGAGVFLLTWDGKLRAAVGHRRIREKPPSGGVSVVRESTSVDPELLGQSLRLLEELGWRDGVAMVEYKLHGASRVPYLMEINGRFWGSLQLAVDAGVDFPSLLLRCALGEAPEEPVVGTPGVTTRWLLGDLDQLLLRLLRGADRLNLPSSDPGRLGSLLAFLKDFRPGVRAEVFRFSDPRPFLRELTTWFQALKPRKGR
jgi:predicted ATP-grasp superfamily ATP-dependent carboligase